MPQHSRLSSEVRHGIIRAYTDHRRRPIAKIADLYDANVSTVRSFLARWRSTGNIEAGDQGGPRYTRLDDQHLNWLSTRLDHYCNSTIDTLWQGLIEAFPEDFRSKPPSSTTVWRAVNNTLRYRLKVMHIEPVDYNLPFRRARRLKWCEDIHKSDIDLRKCIFIDESGFNLHVSNTYGRAAVGSRPVSIRPSSRGPNLTLVLAMNADGVVGYDIIQGGFKAVGFARFLQDKVFPNLTGPEVMIMDNASIHKAPVVKAAIADTPHRCEYLPPYSPFLNAAEWVFGYLKPQCSRKEYHGPNTLRNMIESTLATVNSHQCQGWIKAVNDNWLKGLRGEILGREYLLMKPTTRGDRPEGDVDSDDTDTESVSGEHDGTGVNSTGVNSTGLNGMGVNSTGFNGTNFNGTNFNGTDLSGTNLNSIDSNGRNSNGRDFEVEHGMYRQGSQYVPAPYWNPGGF